jgi:glutathionylspermidine synthase
MAGMAKKMVLTYFESKDVHPQELDDNVIKVSWGLKGTSIDIFFEFDESDTHVHIDGTNFIQVPEDKFNAMYKVVNECNDTYSYEKFVLIEKHSQICVRDDAVIQLDSCGEECYELMMRMAMVVDDAYPKFMKAIWA